MAKDENEREWSGVRTLRVSLLIFYVYLGFTRFGKLGEPQATFWNGDRRSRTGVTLTYC